MKKEYGLAIREFIKSRDYKDASSDLKSLYVESKSWDSFITDAKFLGFKWSQIFFVKNILECYNCHEEELLKWILLHILYQYEKGNLRTPVSSFTSDILDWLPEESPPLDIDFLKKNLLEVLATNNDIFGDTNQPFLIESDYIYINKIKKYENRFLELLNERLSNNLELISDVGMIKKNLESKMNYPLDGLRLEAVDKALKKNFLIISGGPGTGKTTTVVSIIRGLICGGINNILLAAPTGRAAKRMIESINKEKASGDTEMPREAYTLHKLLGIVPNRDRSKYNKDRKIPAQAVIVDEASMVDIHMMYRLFDALDNSTKLILVGDKDQLPSVEAGALLGDFLFNYKTESHKMRDAIVVLDKTYRSIKGIMDCANLVISGDEEEAINYLNSDVPEINKFGIKDIDVTVNEIIKSYNVNSTSNGYKVPVSNYREVIDQIENYFNIFEKFTVLTPSKKGLFGTYSLNNLIKRYFNPGYSPFYHGEPIMITRNDYINGLFNGDRGVVLSFINGLYAFFREAEGFKVVSISKIVDYETAYAGTVHKSQGSEFDSVAIIIPEGSEKMLTREILYTALTRAKKNVSIYSNDEEIRTAIKKRIIRHSGIRDFLVN